jgi:hypothetical protein
MKKLFIVLLAFVSVTASAQSTTPKFGVTPGTDNTGRVLNYAYKAITDAAGADSTVLVLSMYSSIVKVALTDSFCLKSPTVKNSNVGDRLTIIATGASGSKLKFVTASSNWIVASSSATLSTNGRSVINFVFDGAKWVEEARVTQ